MMSELKPKSKQQQSLTTTATKTTSTEVGVGDVDACYYGKNNSSWKSSIVSKDLRELTRPSLCDKQCIAAAAESYNNRSNNISSSSSSGNNPNKCSMQDVEQQRATFSNEHETLALSGTAVEDKSSLKRHREKVTVILRPGVFAGMNSFKGSGPDLKKARSDLKITRVSMTSSTLSIGESVSSSITSPDEVISCTKNNDLVDGNDQFSMSEHASQNETEQEQRQQPTKRRNSKISMNPFTLMDAQHLKFTKPGTYWAPDINELQALQAADKVMLSVLIHGASRRFLVKITKITNFPDKIQGMVNECGLFSILGIRKGTILKFEGRHIFAIHEDYRDAVFDRYISMELTKKNEYITTTQRTT